MNTLTRCGLAALIALAVAAPASAGTVTFKTAVVLDPTVTDFADFFTQNAATYGQLGAYYLTWSAGLAPNSHLLNPGGEPGPGLPDQAPFDPPELSFTFEEPDCSGGTGGSGGTSTCPQGLYTIGSNCPDQAPWSMTFSMLFYDPEFAEDAGVLVEVFGTQGGLDSKTLTGDDVRGGILLSWDLDAGSGEEVKVLVTAAGDVTYPAGFFMSNGEFNCVVPEPASLGLMALGLVGFLLLGRRR